MSAFITAHSVSTKPRNTNNSFGGIHSILKAAPVPVPVSIDELAVNNAVHFEPTSMSTGMDHVVNSFLLSSDVGVGVGGVGATATAGEMKTFEAVAPDSSTLIGFGVVLVLSVIASYVWANEVVPVSRTKLALSKRNGDVKEYLEGLKEAPLANADANAENGDELSLSEELDGVNANTSTSTKRKDKNNVEIKPNVGDGRDVERWLFSDWLNDNKSAGGKGRKKEPALPILKKGEIYFEFRTSTTYYKKLECSVYFVMILYSHSLQYNICPRTLFTIDSLLTSFYCTFTLRKAKWNSGDNPVLVTAGIMMVGIVIASITERVQ